MTNDLEIRDRLKSLEHEVRALRDWAARLFTRFPTIPGGGVTGDCQITIGCGLTITDELELRIAAAVLVGAGLISDPEDPNCPLDVNPGDGIEIGPEHNTVQTKIARGLNFVTVGGATRAVEPLLGECLEFNASTGAIDLSDGCGADDDLGRRPFPEQERAACHRCETDGQYHARPCFATRRRLDRILHLRMNGLHQRRSDIRACGDECAAHIVKQPVSMGRFRFQPERHERETRQHKNAKAF